jgi:hypothetical protein
MSGALVSCLTGSGFHLTVQVQGGGTTDPAPGSYLLMEGGQLRITATPDAGWTFDHWEGQYMGLSDGFIREVLLVESAGTANVIAVFRQLATYTITDASLITFRESGVTGSVAVNPNQGYDTDDATISVTIASGVDQVKAIHVMLYYKLYESDCVGEYYSMGSEFHQRTDNPNVWEGSLAMSAVPNLLRVEAVGKDDSWWGYPLLAYADLKTNGGPDCSIPIPDQF